MKDCKPIYKIRAHHGMCLAFFQGRGYSDAFAKHMQSVKEMLERTNPMVCITTETDILCRECPNNREGICISLDTVAEYDKQVLLRCDLSEGNVIPFREFEKTVFESILLPQKREEICGGCEWSALCHLNLPKDKSSHEKAEA